MACDSSRAHLTSARHVCLNKPLNFDALLQLRCTCSTSMHPLNLGTPAQPWCIRSTSMHLLNFDAPVQFRCTFISSMHFTTMIAASNGRQVHRVLKSALNFEKCTEFHEVHQASRSASGFKGASSLKNRIGPQEAHRGCSTGRSDRRIAKTPTRRTAPTRLESHRPRTYPQLTGMYNRFCSERSPLPRKMYNRFDSACGISAGRSFTTGR